jgi:hypothetical protein
MNWPLDWRNLFIAVAVFVGGWLLKLLYDRYSTKIHASARRLDARSPRLAMLIAILIGLVVGPALTVAAWKLWLSSPDETPILAVDYNMEQPLTSGKFQALMIRQHISPVVLQSFEGSSGTNIEWSKSQILWYRCTVRNKSDKRLEDIEVTWRVRLFSGSPHGSPEISQRTQMVPLSILGAGESFEFHFVNASDLGVSVDLPPHASARKMATTRQELRVVQSPESGIPGLSGLFFSPPPKPEKKIQ